MSLIVKYYPHLHKNERFSENLSMIAESGFEGILFPIVKSEGLSPRQSYEVHFYQINKMTRMAKEYGLTVGLIIECFHSDPLWKLNTFSAPVSFSGASYAPMDWYHPLCPNNPMAIERFSMIVNKAAKCVRADFVYLDFLRFPFFWEKEQLDVQHRMPPYCYCPFCLGEFSSIVGEIIHTSSQIYDLIEEWLEWRNYIIVERLISAKEKLQNNFFVTVSFPPLANIDLAFTTGQTPSIFTDEGCYVSPILHHSIKNKKLNWVDDMLDQYKMDLKPSKIIPSLQVTSMKDLETFKEWDDDFPFINLFNWMTLRDLIRVR